MNKQDVYLAALLMDIPHPGIQQFLEMKIGSDVLQNQLLKNILHHGRRLALGGDHDNLTSAVPLASVYEEIFNNDYQASWFYEASLMSLEKQHFFPVKGLEYNASSVSKCWDSFLSEVKKLKSSDSGVLGDCTLALLKKYAVKIHCNFENNPSISYYDYAKSLAGISVCLFEWCSQNSVQLEQIEGEKPFILVGGDLSGIQDFIYDIISKNAAKNLKGRSFYLQLIVNSILSRFLKELNLFKCNIIFDSGGGFNLLIPNLETVKNDLLGLEKEVSKQLFETHKTILSLGVDCLIVSYNDLYTASVGELQEKLHKNLSSKKNRKHLNEVDNYDNLFGDQVEVGGLVARDVITGDEIGIEELHKAWFLNEEDSQVKKASKKEKDDGVNLLKENTAKQVILGTELKKLDYWVVTENIVDGLSKSIERRAVNPCNLGGINYLISDEEWKDTSIRQQLIPNAKIIYAINDASISLELIPKDCLIEFQYYGGNEFPKTKVIRRNGKEDEITKTFSEMAGALDEDRKKRYKEYGIEELDFKRLGVLRMDVDDLGYIFQKGFVAASEKQNISFAKYATLSRSMDFFFKGYLNKIWEEEDLREHAQIIYAGGDDLFVIGRWDVIIQFAQQVQKDFRKWTCENDKLGISGGMSIVTHKYPVVKAADMAGDAEGKAKKHQRNKKRILNSDLEKKSFTILGTPLYYGEHPDWQNEWAMVKELKDQLIQLIGNGKKDLSKGALIRIMVLEEMRKNAIENEKNPQWKWLTAYYFSKTADDLRRRGGIDIAAYLKERSQDIMFNKYKGKEIKSSYSFLQLYALAARWAELERRQTEAINKSKNN